MDISPQRVRSAEFKSVRKGVDPEQVRTFLSEVADELERAQNQATAMEARARAAVARLQEVGEGTPAKADTETPVTTEASVDEVETISRTLLLAQRTADTTIAEAKAEADRVLRGANDEAAATRDSTREMAAQLLDEARVKARQAGESERLTVAGEVDSLKARRDFLESDVEHLELFLADQRNRIREAATSLLDLTDRVPGGLATVRPPLLSAADDGGAGADGDDDGGADTFDVAADEPVDNALDDAVEFSLEDDDADADDDDADGAGVDDLVIQTDIADDDPVDHASAGDDSGDLSWIDRDAPTQAMPVVESARSADDSGGFRFSFDDDR